MKKTIAQQFAENREDRDKFEAFKSEYLSAHKTTAKRFNSLVFSVDSLEQQAEEIRRAIAAAKRGDEMAAHGPAGVGPNGLPMYYAERFQTLEAPEYLAYIEAEREEMAAKVAKIVDKIRKEYAKAAEATAEATAEAAEETAEATAEAAEETAEATAEAAEATAEAAAEETTETTETTEQPAEATELTQSDRDRSAYLNTCEECEAIEATGDPCARMVEELRTLAAETLRTRAPEWVEELETLQREALAYSAHALQNRRSGAEGTGYHPRP